MNIVIVGPGAIGCLFALRLARAGHSPALLDHDPARAEHVSRTGLVLDDKAPVMLPVTADPGTLPPADLLLMCVKSYDTPAAIEAAAPLLTSDGTVVSMQNGAGNAEALSTVVPDAQVLCAATTEGATLDGPGHVRHRGAGLTSVAPWRPDQGTRADALCTLFLRAGFRAVAAGDAQRLLWEKLVVSSAINPLTAIHDISNGGILKVASLREAAEETARETDRVARACGINVSGSDPAIRVRSVCRDTSENISSMLQDVRRGARTEIEAINGYVVRCAQARGVPTPRNGDLLTRVQTLEKSDGTGPANDGRLADR